MNGKKKMCYLVGQISPKFDITYTWRKHVRDEMKEFEDQIGFIDPCANSFNKKVLEKKSYAVTEQKRSFGIDVLPHKDLTFVLESDMAIVDLNQYDPNKPLLGSFFELAWYFMNPQKTVIGYAENLNSYLCQHPFVQGAVSTWVRDTDEAIYILKKYFVNAGE
jgi:nucleoside 2-deoxyribosyltransferase